MPLTRNGGWTESSPLSSLLFSPSPLVFLSSLIPLSLLSPPSLLYPSILHCYFYSSMLPAVTSSFMHFSEIGVLSYKHFSRGTTNCRQHVDLLYVGFSLFIHSRSSHTHTRVFSLLSHSELQQCFISIRCKLICIDEQVS